MVSIDQQLAQCHSQNSYHNPLKLRLYQAELIRIYIFLIPSPFKEALDLKASFDCCDQIYKSLTRFSNLSTINKMPYALLYFPETHDNPSNPCQAKLIVEGGET